MGLVVAFILILYDFDVEKLGELKFNSNSWMWLLIAILMMVFRDLGYIHRLRILSEKALSWKQSFQLTFLWEFASAISPGIVGGTAAAFVLLAQEKIGTGKSTAIVLATSFLDVLFYVLLVPLLALVTGTYQYIPSIELPTGVMDKRILLAYFVIAYFMLLAWAIFVFICLFIRPQISRNFMNALFKLPVLRRWQTNAKEWGDELVITSKELGNKSMRFWFSAFGATVFSWVARFAVVNFIVLALAGSPDHFEIFIKQLIMWCILLLPISPGATGLAEVLFPAFLHPYFPNRMIAKLGALLWRMLSYYPYLLIGFVIFPVWIQRIIRTRNNSKQEVQS
ncbi:MAG: flippase-like domain-containing protein [Bacteroidia bacterium]